MATSSKILITPAIKGEFSVQELSEASAAKASEVLQKNHEDHHIFFNKAGFHNHIVHHMLTLYALGASQELIQSQFEHNASYQRPPEAVDTRVVAGLHDPAKFKDYLGPEKYYHDFLLFFQQEIDKKGYEDVINEYMLKGDERADDMLVRMYAGFLHPIIHLGFGVEFKQPAIVAEALAEAAAHDIWIGDFLHAAEKASKSATNGKNLVRLLDEIRADKKLSTAAHWNDGNKIRDGVMKRAPEEMIKYASQWSVSADDLEEKTAEMINAAVYFTGGAQHPPKEVKFDFYYMHCVNCSIFYSAFLKAPWISTANKVRLLEWKGRLDLCMYASRRSPTPLLDEIENYHPKEEGKPGSQSWQAIFERVMKHDDDGHAAKLVRALAHAEEAGKPYEGDERFRVKGKMWLQLANMAIDSVEASSAEEGTWVRSAGFDEAWEKFSDRPRAQL